MEAKLIAGSKAGVYLVIVEGRVIGRVQREQVRTARMGTYNFVAYLGWNTTRRYVGSFDTRKAAVAFLVNNHNQKENRA